MKPGDIHWVELPTAGGREQQGRRPAVIVQDDRYGGDLPVVLVVPLTTAGAANRFVGTVTVHPTPENGLRQESIALVFQVRAIDRRRLQEPIGNLDEQTLTAIFHELGKLTGRVPRT